MKYTTIALPDNFEKGECLDCPFSYIEDATPVCVFYCRYDECPVEVGKVVHIEDKAAGEKIREQKCKQETT